MSVSNYVLNQRISNLQYEIDNLGPDVVQNLANVLTKGNKTGYQSIVNNDNTLVLNTQSNNSSLTMQSGTDISILSASNLTFNGSSIIPLPIVKTLINIVSTANFTVNIPVYYTSSLKNGIIYLNPSIQQLTLTFLNGLNSYNIAVLTDVPIDEDYYFTQWTALNDMFVSYQVYLTCDVNKNLILNIPSGPISTGEFVLNLPSFSYIVG